MSAGAYLALLSFMDLSMYLYIAYTLGVDPLTLGVASALWSASFIFSNAIFNHLVDKGSTKLASLISGSSLVVSSLVLFNSNNVVLCIVMYMLHALATASGRLASNVALLEFSDSNDWSFLNSLMNFLTTFIRGLLLVFFSLGFLTLNIVYVTVIALTTLYVITLPNVWVSIERSVFSMSKQLEALSKHVRVVTALTYLVERPYTAAEAFESLWRSSKEFSPVKPLLSVFLLVTGSDTLMAMLPLILRSKIATSDTYMVYGIASLIAAVVLIAVSTCRGSKGMAILAISARILVFPTLLLLDNLTFLVTFLVLANVFYNIYVTSVYYLYVKATSGYKLSLYNMSLEAGSILGSLIGGYLTFNYGYNYTLIASIIGHIASAIILI